MGEGKRVGKLCPRLDANFWRKVARQRIREPSGLDGNR